MKRLPKPVTAPPSSEELAMRLDKVRILMRDQDLDYYVSFDPVNIYYLTHFANNVHERPFILVFPKKGTPPMATWWMSGTAGHGSSPEGSSISSLRLWFVF